MFTLSREFPHPTDLLHKATPAAQQRFFKDSKRFPPQSYEERSLAWKDTAWRQLYPEERCSIMGLPIGYLDPLTVGEGDSQDASSVRAAKNCAVGNGYHVPSFMIFALALFATLGSSEGTVPRPLYGGLEARLREFGGRSVLNDTVLKSYPGLLDGPELAREARQMLPDIDSFDWDDLGRRLSKVPLARLQAYWVDAALRGRDTEVQGPEWSAQRHRASLLASFGKQRATSDSKRGLAPLITAGLGPSDHLCQALRLPHPFHAVFRSDDDLSFAGSF